ncbi:hypothetical protein [Thermocatellispora tengchongensis]
MDVLDLARSQFAVTGSLHFLFVVLTLGLAPWWRSCRPGTPSPESRCGSG